MELSKRLQTLADMVTPGNRIADIGCDHGFVSIYLCEKHISPKVYAMDVRKGPLSRAEEHITAHGLTDYIETRLSDGLDALKADEAEAVICAGMGGRLMARILLEGLSKVMQMKELILQPQSEPAFFRQFLHKHHLVIVEERLVKEEGKFYPMMRVLPHGDEALYPPFDGNGLLTLEEAKRVSDTYGALLLWQKHPLMQEYLTLLLNRNKGILSSLPLNGQEKRRAEIGQELSDMEKCLLWLAG
ncbi:MAG: SAM-dependent methyltransferase [Lachnospiraceae bacterium]|nr:SAM-dependent methyltransferase [Lachnospiraceae bacterium]